MDWARSWAGKNKRVGWALVCVGFGFWVFKINKDPFGLFMHKDHFCNFQKMKGWVWDLSKV